jgi:phage FluMu protein Com
MDLVTYVALRCPHCKYVWARREERMPVSCPRCKKRFDYIENRVELEQMKVATASYSDMKDWLIEANRHSLQWDSMEEIAERLEQE